MLLHNAIVFTVCLLKMARDKQKKTLKVINKNINMNNGYH